MRLEIVRDAQGAVLAAVELASDEGVVPEAVLEEGQTTEVVDVRRTEFVGDLDGLLKRLGRKG